MKREREFADYLRDIVVAIEKAESFTEGMDYERFVKDEKTVFAVIRALEIIGEAIKNLPEQVRKERPDVNWRGFAGIRDRLIHGYFTVDLSRIWETVRKDLPGLLEATRELLEKALRGELK
ncbi:MAG: DUF86 domain-containing protein [Candidatus Binatia bacterium]